MDYKYIEQLLDRYWACETTLQEESILRTFFTQNDVPAHLKPYQGLFLYNEEEKEEKLSDEVTERILSQTVNKETTGTTVKVKKLNPRYRLRPFFRAAATVAIFLTLGMAVQQAMYKGQENQPGATQIPAAVPAAPETAYDQVEVHTPDSSNILPSVVDKEMGEKTGVLAPIKQ